MSAKGNSKKKTKNSAAKTSTEKTSAEKTTIVEPDPNTEEIVAYEEEAESNIDLTEIPDTALQQEVDKRDLELSATQLQLAPERKKLFDEYLEVCKKREQLAKKLSPLTSDYEIKRMNQMFGKHSTLTSLPIGYMPSNGLRGLMSLEDIHKKMKKDIINCIVAKNTAVIEAALQKSVSDLKRHFDTYAKNSTRMITDAVQNVQAGTNLNVFKKVSRKRQRTKKIQ